MASDTRRKGRAAALARCVGEAIKVHQQLTRPIQHHHRPDEPSSWNRGRACATHASVASKTCTTRYLPPHLVVAGKADDKHDSLDVVEAVQPLLPLVPLPADFHDRELDGRIEDLNAANAGRHHPSHHHVLLEDHHKHERDNTDGYAYNDSRRSGPIWVQAGRKPRLGRKVAVASRSDLQHTAESRYDQFSLFAEYCARRSTGYIVYTVSHILYSTALTARHPNSGTARSKGAGSIPPHVKAATGYEGDQTAVDNMTSRDQTTCWASEGDRESRSFSFGTHERAELPAKPWFSRSTYKRCIVSTRRYHTARRTRRFFDAMCRRSSFVRGKHTGFIPGVLILRHAPRRHRKKKKEQKKAAAQEANFDQSSLRQTTTPGMKAVHLPMAKGLRRHIASKNRPI